MLLWHGSRTTNFAGILTQGLRIAPPEAPVTGYMFGKGGFLPLNIFLLVFFNRFLVPQFTLPIFHPKALTTPTLRSKTTRFYLYLFISHLLLYLISYFYFLFLQQGILLLCQVALGEMNELVAADYNADKLPPGKHSVKGLGRTEPDPKDQGILLAFSPIVWLDHFWNFFPFCRFGNTVVPFGQGKPTGVKNPNGYTLQ